MTSTTTILLFLLPALVGPVTIPLLDWVMGLASPTEIAAALDARAIGVFVLTLVVGTALTIGALRLAQRHGNRHDPRVFRVLAAGPPLVLAWSIIHNLAFSVVMHHGAAFITDATGLFLVGIYATAVGTFFGILTVIGSLRSLETGLSRELVRSDSARTLTLTARLFLSVTITVVAFVFGGLSLALYPVYGGLSVGVALGRISVVALPFVVLTLLLVWFLSQMITRPVARAVPGLKSLTEGTLTTRLETRGIDEVARALDSINMLAESVEASIRQATEGASTAAELSARLDSQAETQRSAVASASQNVETVSSRAGELREKVDAAASATEEISRTLENLEGVIGQQSGAVDETASSSEELGATAENVVDVSVKRRDAAQELKEVIAEGRTQLDEADRTMSELSGKIGDLDDLNKVIANLAAQTNLLSMNAAIEAAHAGDAGAGFAVVANEIRNLAESASKSASDSSSFLKETAGGIGRGTEVMATVRRSFDRIEGETVSVVESMEEIVSAAKEMNESARGITEMMTRVKDANADVVAGVSQINEGVREINETSQATREVANTTSETLSSVGSQMTEVSQSADAVASIAGDLKSSAQRLAERLAQYQVGGAV
ncbi:MAG: hypothetical protein GVY14_11950 [Spirochaetes bacterium]|jgi:methyl-accepting chemotaxis protein|nr:hypothetical protein [Spirochaetota bacterium]